MTKIMFICHGNICRSPMAEFVFKDMVKKAGREKEFFITSAATSTEEIGNPIYPDTRRILQKYNIECTGHRAVRMTSDDYNRYDLLIVMDSNNLRNALRIVGHDDKNKIKKLMDYTGGGDVADPWYTGDFETTYRDILSGCKALLDSLK